MATSKVFHSIRDITQGNMILLEKADKDLVVLDVDNIANFTPAKQGLKRPMASIVAEEQLMGKLKMDHDLASKLLDIGGWMGAGMRLPFANKENNELEKILEIKQRRFLAVQSELHDTAEHLRMLKQNFSRASEDVTFANNFLINRRRQIEEARSQFSVADRYFNRLRQDLKETEKTFKLCHERCKKMEESQEKRLQNLAELRNLIEFDREALQEYHERLTNYQNQKLELRKIIEEDAKKVEELDKRYVELGAKRKVLNRELDLQAMQSTKCQEQLDRLSQEFRRFYKHRQQLINMWSTCIETAKKKDAQMNEVAEVNSRSVDAQEYHVNRQVFRELNAEIEHCIEEYRHLICMNRRATFVSSEKDKVIGDTRNNLQSLRAESMHLKDSILELQTDIRSVSMEHQNVDLKIQKLEEEISLGDHKLEKTLAAVEQLRQRLNEVRVLRRDADMSVNDLENIYNAEVKKADKLLRDLEITRHQFWERSNERKILMGDMAHAETTMGRHRASLVNLEAREFVNMEFLAKQSAKVYRLDLECSNLEKKIRDNTNQGIHPQFISLQGEIARLKEVQRKIEKDRVFISKELNTLGLMITLGGSDLAKNRLEKDALKGQIMQIDMVSQRTEKLLDETEKKIMDTKVEMCLEMVNLRRLEDAKRSANEKLFGLTEERKSVYAAVKERKTEIAHTRALNLHKSKALMDAVGKLKLQINEMTGRNQKLKGRFELVTKMMTGSRSDGDQASVAQKVKEAARERESLQLELRRWEKCVDEAKQELAALENVLKLMHASNANVKDKLIPITDDSYESNQLELLDQEENALYVRKNRAIAFKRVLFDKLEDLQQKIAVMEQETQATFQMSKVKGVTASKVENEILRQKEKVQRWSTLCCKMLKEVKPSINKSDYLFFQKNLHLRMIQEKLDCAMTMVDRLISSHPNVKPWVYDFFEHNDQLHSIVYKLLKPTSGSISFGGARGTVHQRIHYEVDTESVTSSSSAPARTRKMTAKQYGAVGRRSAVFRHHEHQPDDHSQSQSTSDSRSKTSNRNHKADDDTSYSQSLSLSDDK